MQVEAHILYGRRAIYYLSKTYTDQLETGDNYSKLNTTIGIHFLDFKYFDDDRVLRQFVFKDTETNQSPVELDYVRLYFVEMGKFDKDWPEIRTTLDRWVAFLNKAENLNQAALPDQLASDLDVVKAVNQLGKIGLNPEERVIYEGEVKKRMIDEIQLQTAEDRGMQRGIQHMQHLLLRLMTRRIGEVPASITARLKSLSTEALEDLGLELLDFNSYADVERWLTSH